MTSYHLNEPIVIIGQNESQYFIEYEDGYREWVDKVEVDVYVTKGLKKVNQSRHDKNFVKYYGSLERVEIIKNTPCVICSALPSDNVHVVSKAAGGNYKDIVPLCRKHHLESHQIGTLTFSEKYNIDLIALAEEYAKIKP